MHLSCLRGTLLQSTYSDVFAGESTKVLCGKLAGGRSLQGTAPTATLGCCPLAKLEIQNMFSFDWRSLVLFVKETSNTVRKTKLVIAVSGI